MDEDRIGEVSGDCLAAFRILSKEFTGDEEKIFIDGLEHLKLTPTRFRWSELNILYKRLEGITPVGMTLVEIGETMIRLPKIGAILRSVALVMSPQTLYRYAVPYTLRHIFSHLDVKLSIENNSIIVEIRIPEEYEDSPHFFQITEGVYRSYPQLIGLKQATVTSEVRPYYGRYEILPPVSNTIWNRLRRLVDFVYKNIKNIPNLFSVLIQQQRQLNIQYQELIQSHEALQEAHASTEQILKIMSHELRTPLNGVRGAITMLREEKEPAVIRELLDALDESSTRQTKALTDMSDVAKAVTHRLLVNPSECRIRQVIEETCVELKQLAKNKWLGFDLQILESVPGKIIIDESRVIQIVSHIIGNAIKFSYIGTIRVSVDCDRHSSMFKLKVEDEGIGLMPDRIDKVFELFYQVDTGAARSAQGLGLGLSLCKYITDAMKGTISIESKIGIGTTVEVLVPYGPVVLDSGVDTPDIDYYRKSALVVDDNKVNRLVLGRMAHKLGLEIYYAENGVIAVSQVDKEPYDIIFMDIEMPEMNGIEATVAIRKKGIKTPIIAVTAYTMPEDRDACFKAGMNDFLSKPINKLTVERRIRKWITMEEKIS